MSRATILALVMLAGSPMPVGSQSGARYTPAVWQPLGDDGPRVPVRSTVAEYVESAAVVPVPDPVSGKKIVVSMCDPSGNVFWAGADNAEDAAKALSLAYKAAKPDLIPATTTRTTTETRSPLTLTRGQQWPSLVP